MTFLIPWYGNFIFFLASLVPPFLPLRKLKGCSWVMREEIWFFFSATNLSCPNEGPCKVSESWIGGKWSGPKYINFVNIVYIVMCWGKAQSLGRANQVQRWAQQASPPLKIKKLWPSETWYEQINLALCKMYNERLVGSWHSSYIMIPRYILCRRK